MVEFKKTKFNYRKDKDLWWVSQPESHSFYLRNDKYRAIQEWYQRNKNMDTAVIVFAGEILGELHPTHSISILRDDFSGDILGSTSDPVYKEFPLDVRHELKNFSHG